MTIRTPAPPSSFAHSDPTRATPGAGVKHYATPRSVAAWRRGAIALTLTVTFVQLVFFFKLDNLAMSLMLALGSLLGYGYALRQSRLKRYPLSALMILGYTASYFTLPPVGQLLDLNPITHNLDHPSAVGAYALVGLLAILAGHVLYAKFGFVVALRNVLRRGFYQKIGFFREPMPGQLWPLGLLGMAGVFASRSYASGEQSVVDAFVSGFQPFVYLPYLMLLLPAWSSRASISRLHKNLLWPYTGALLILSFVANSRAFLLVGFASLGIMYVYGVLVGRIQVPRLRLRTLVLLGVAFVVVTGPLTRLAMSMVLVRGERAELTAVQLVSATWDTFLHEDVARKYADLWAAFNEDPDTRENYFDNLFLNRLGNLKFVDNAVKNSLILGDGGARRFAADEFDKALSIMPAPLLRLLQIDVDKKLYTGGSSGDFLLYEATGNSYAIGGFRTGSLLVNLRVVFGILWPVVLALLVSLVFAVSDALCRPEKNPGDGTLWVRFNPLIAGLAFTYAFMLTSAATGTDGLAGLLGPLLRGWIQVGVLYAAAYHLSRLMIIKRRA